MYVLLLELLQEQKRVSNNISKWKSVTVRLKEPELAILNQKLNLHGFENFSQFIHAWINGTYPYKENNQQVERLLKRLRQKDIKDPLTGEFNPNFFRNVNVDEMFTDLSKRYIYKKHAKDLVNYFQRYAEIFFTKPELIRDETGHKRAWICDAMRRFGEYYDRKFHNPELKILINEIIQRYEINKKMKIHDRIWVSDENYLDKMIRSVLTIPGDLGIIIKFALFSGLRGEEITYVHGTEICEKIGSCNCKKLHIIEKEIGHSIVILNRIVGQKRSFFTIIPTTLWKNFLQLKKVHYEERKIAHNLLKNHTEGKVSFMDLRKFHYNLLCRSEMKEIGAEILAGRTKSVSAQHYLLNELDKMVFQYHKAWKEYFINIK